jgi:uncharacterized RDD family membrane protein YckC
MVMVEEPRAKVPGRWNYVLGTAIIIAGVAVCLFLIVKEAVGWIPRGVFGGMIPNSQFVVPGTHEIPLAKQGEHAIFYEYRSFLDGKTFSTSENVPPGLDVTLKAAEGGALVALSKPSLQETYDRGQRAGFAILRFRVLEPGKYVLTANYPAGAKGTEVVLAIGESFEPFEASKGLLAQTLGAFWGGILVGGFIIARTAVNRRRLRHTQASLSQPTPILGEVICPNCRTAATGSASFCSNCGSPIGARAAAPVARQGAAQRLSVAYMGFWIRVPAALIDYAVLGILGFLLELTGVPVLGNPLLIVAYLAEVWAIGRTGQTLGKKLFGIMVVNAQGSPPGFRRAFVREIPGKFVSTLTFLLGFLVVGWNEQKRGLHDLIAGTYVVRK